jgi:hypothetical protein
MGVTLPIETFVKLTGVAARLKSETEFAKIRDFP